MQDEQVRISCGLKFEVKRWTLKAPEALHVADVIIPIRFYLGEQEGPMARLDMGKRIFIDQTPLEREDEAEAVTMLIASLVSLRQMWKSLHTWKADPVAFAKDVLKLNVPAVTVKAKLLR